MSVDVKILIKILKRTICSLGVEEIHDRNEQKIERREDYTMLAEEGQQSSREEYTDIEAICKVLDSGWSELSADKPEELKISVSIPR